MLNWPFSSTREAALFKEEILYKEFPFWLADAIQHNCIATASSIGSCSWLSNTEAGTGKILNMTIVTAIRG